MPRRPYNPRNRHNRWRGSRQPSRSESPPDDTRTPNTPKRPQDEIENMSFEEASKAVMPFGKHEGKTLDKIASTDDGLKYLDWLAGRGLYGKIKVAILVYMADDVVKEELRRILAGE